MKRLVAVTTALLFSCEFGSDIHDTGHTILLQELVASDQQLTGTWNQWKYDSICEIKLQVHGTYSFTSDSFYYTGGPQSPCCYTTVTTDEQGITDSVITCSMPMIIAVSGSWKTHGDTLVLMNSATDSTLLKYHATPDTLFITSFDSAVCDTFKRFHELLL